MTMLHVGKLASRVQECVLMLGRGSLDSGRVTRVSSEKATHARVMIVQPRALGNTLKRLLAPLGCLFFVFSDDRLAFRAAILNPLFFLPSCKVVVCKFSDTLVEFRDALVVRNSTIFLRRYVRTCCIEAGLGLGLQFMQHLGIRYTQCGGRLPWSGRHTPCHHT
jgi:hypothetical protein